MSQPGGKKKRLGDLLVAAAAALGIAEETDVLGDAVFETAAAVTGLLNKYPCAKSQPRSLR